jgi:hypothetical protein
VDRQPKSKHQKARSTNPCGGSSAVSVKVHVPDT